MHTRFTKFVSPHRFPVPHLHGKLWIQVDCCANKQNNNTHTRTSQCKNNIVIVNCFRCNSHIILNAPILYVNQMCIYQNAAHFLPSSWELFGVPFCLRTLYVNCGIHRWNHNFITLLYTVFGTTYFQTHTHTVCVTFLLVLSSLVVMMLVLLLQMKMSSTESKTFATLQRNDNFCVLPLSLNGANLPEFWVRNVFMQQWWMKRLEKADVRRMTWRISFKNGSQNVLTKKKK